ncbi:MAG: PaaI family thioesterase, partial [Ramlibacter sp.]
AAVLTIEFKINLLAPAKGQRFRMVGEVVKPGRTVTVVEGKAFAIDEGREKLVATMHATLMAVVGRDGIQN